MCLRPLKIGNASRRFVPGLSKPQLYVPCGHCKECIQKQQDDWFVRSVFEAKRVQQRGGAVWFPTLTYNNDHLPFWYDEKHGFSCPCFDTDHIKAFRNKLRVYLSRAGYDCSGSNTIRYMICCEYGDEKGRSHLHCLLYVPFYVPASLMNEVLNKAWIYGYVMWSKKGMIANGLKASQYCMKYISKEMNWYKKYKIDDYLQTLHDDIYKAADDSDEREAAKQLLKDFRHVTPNHRQSMGFGIDGLEYFRHSDGSWDYERLIDGRFDASKIGVPPTKKGQNFMYNMPMYYIRKIFYDVDAWNLYKFNSLGKEIFSLRFEISQKRKEFKFEPYFTSCATLAEHLAPLGLPLPTISSLYDKLTGLLGERSLSDLVMFDTVYRDIALTDANSSLVDMLIGSDSDDLDFLRFNSLRFMLAQKDLDVEPLPEKVKKRSNYRVAENTFNNVPCFRGFVDILDCIRNYESLLGDKEQAAYVIERLRQENLFGSDGNYIINPKIYVL